MCKDIDKDDIVTSGLSSVYDTNLFFISLLERAFKVMKNGVCDSNLGCRFIQDFDLCKLDDL